MIPDPLGHRILESDPDSLGPDSTARRSLQLSCPQSALAHQVLASLGLALPRPDRRPRFETVDRQHQPRSLRGGGVSTEAAASDVAPDKAPPSKLTFTEFLLPADGSVGVRTL